MPLPQHSPFGGGGGCTWTPLSETEKESQGRAVPAIMYTADNLLRNHLTGYEL